VNNLEPARRSRRLLVVALICMASGAFATAYVDRTVLFPRYLARELAWPSKPPLLTSMDIPAPGGRSIGCSYLPNPRHVDLEYYRGVLFGNSRHTPSAHCLIRAVGDRGEAEGIGLLLSYALVLNFAEALDRCTTIAAALADIGGPLVRKTAAALTYSDDWRLRLIGVLTLAEKANARERLFLMARVAAPDFMWERGGAVAWAYMSRVSVEWGFFRDWCGPYGCVLGTAYSGHPIPLTLDD
jgi:hypothetical protein